MGRPRHLGVLFKATRVPMRDDTCPEGRAGGERENYLLVVVSSIQRPGIQATTTASGVIHQTRKFVRSFAPLCAGRSSPDQQEVSPPPAAADFVFGSATSLWTAWKECKEWYDDGCARGVSIEKHSTDDEEEEADLLLLCNIRLPFGGEEILLLLLFSLAPLTEAHLARFGVCSGTVEGVHDDEKSFPWQKWEQGACRLSKQHKNYPKAMS